MRANRSRRANPNLTKPDTKCDQAEEFPDTSRARARARIGRETYGKTPLKT